MIFSDKCRKYSLPVARSTNQILLATKSNILKDCQEIFVRQFAFNEIESEKKKKILYNVNSNLKSKISIFFPSKR